MAATSTLHQQTENIRGKAQEVGDKAKEAAGNVYEKGKDLAASAADKAKEIASGGADVAKQTASALGQRAEDAAHAAGKGMESLAETMRQNLPQKGVLGSAASTVASGLESGGQYLEQEGLSGLGNDVINLVRRNPIPAVLIGIGVGFCLARATMAASRRD